MSHACVTWCWVAHLMSKMAEEAKAEERKAERGRSCDEICQFLRRRFVEEDVIEKVKQEKMDGVAVKYASNETLKSELCIALGDILGLRSFCSDYESGGNERQLRKQKLFQRLFGCEKNQTNKKSRQSVISVKQKKDVKVYIGWKHYDECDKRYRQIRLSKGGGIREIKLPLTSTFHNILDLATEKFFKNGRNSMGCLNDMELCLGNFQGDKIQENESPGFTLEVYREAYNLPRIKIYLLSKKKEKGGQSPTDESINDDTNLLKSPFDTSVNVSGVLDDDEVTFKECGTVNPLGADDTLEMSQGSSDSETDRSSESTAVESTVTEQVPAVHSIGNSNDPGLTFRQVTLPHILEQQGLSVQSEGDSTDQEQEGGILHPPEDNYQVVLVHRARIKEDLVSIFESDVKATLSFRVVDLQGRVEVGEGEGVARDIISTFWQQLFSSATIGDVEKVPVTRHDYHRSTWEAVGRILVYSFEKLGFFPLGISRAFLASCLFVEQTMDDAFILASFRNYITCDEREILDGISQGHFRDDDEDLLDFLGNYKCYKLPTKETVQNIVSELAHHELIQKPRYIAECFREVLSGLKQHEAFKSTESITTFYCEKRPTAKKVISALKANPSNDAERESLQFLKKFIRSLDAKSLGTFLKYTTGSTILTDLGLSVSFTMLDGLARRPIAHTCGPLLELPCTFQSYSELAEEFTSILSEKGAWGFNIV